MKPLILPSYSYRKNALLELTYLEDAGKTKGICRGCGKPARLLILEAPPIGDQEQFYIGTDCCGDQLCQA